MVLFFILYLFYIHNRLIINKLGQRQNHLHPNKMVLIQKNYSVNIIFFVSVNISDSNLYRYIPED